MDIIVSYRIPGKRKKKVDDPLTGESFPTSGNSIKTIVEDSFSALNKVIDY